MDFLSKFFGGLRGNDRYSRGIAVQELNQIKGMVSRQTQEQWLTINDNEYLLYKTTPELYVVINKFASMLSNGRWVVKDLKTEQEIPNHPLVKLLERPNPLTNRNEWLREIAVNFNVYGNSIIFKNKGSELSDFPSTLVNLPVSETVVNVSGLRYRKTEINEIITNYAIKGTDDKFLPEEIIHLKNTNLDNLTLGMSPLLPLQPTITNIRGARGFRNVNITQRGALGVFSPEGGDAYGATSFSEPERIALEEQYTKKTHGIFDGMNSIKFSPKPIKYQHTSFPIKDAMLFEEVEEGFNRICDGIGIKKEVFSSTKSTTFNNVLEGVKSSYQETIIPFSEQICFAITDGLNLNEHGIYVELDFSKVSALSNDEKSEAYVLKTRVESMKTLIELGVSKEEAIKITGLQFP